MKTLNSTLIFLLSLMISLTSNFFSEPQMITTVTSAVSEMTHTQLDASMVDMDARHPLPRSFYNIYFWTTDGIIRRHNGVAFQSNALLSSNHLLPKGVSPEDVIRIQLVNEYGEVHTLDDASQFMIRRTNSFTIVVLQNEVIPQANLSPLGDADDLSEGAIAQQAILKGTTSGIYPTIVEGTLTVNGNSPREYQGLSVAPDRTISGDSGSPVYVNGTVYCINNSGRGVCGAIQNPGQIYRMVSQMSATLNHHPFVLMMSQSTHARLATTEQAASVPAMSALMQTPSGIAPIVPAPEMPSQAETHLLLSAQPSTKFIYEAE